MSAEIEHGKTRYLVKSITDEDKFEWVPYLGKGQECVGQGYFVETPDSLANLAAGLSFDPLTETAPLLVMLSAALSPDLLEQEKRRCLTFNTSVFVINEFQPSELSHDIVFELLQQELPILRGKFFW